MALLAGGCCRGSSVRPGMLSWRCWPEDVVTALLAGDGVEVDPVWGRGDQGEGGRKQSQYNLVPALLVQPVLLEPMGAAVP